jgi:hypothetical protein
MFANKLPKEGDIFAANHSSAMAIDVCHNSSVTENLFERKPLVQTVLLTDTPPHRRCRRVWIARSH